jgi:hypothetical protein
MGPPSSVAGYVAQVEFMMVEFEEDEKKKKNEGNNV